MKCLLLLTGISLVHWVNSPSLFSFPLNRRPGLWVGHVKGRILVESRHLGTVERFEKGLCVVVQTKGRVTPGDTRLRRTRLLRKRVPCHLWPRRVSPDKRQTKRSTPRRLVAADRMQVLWYFGLFPSSLVVILSGSWKVKIWVCNLHPRCRFTYLWLVGQVFLLYQWK